MDHVVGISEYAVSCEPDDRLITYSLGSCVGLALYDPVAGVAGLLHAMMPLSRDNPARAAETPAMYCDTGTCELLSGLYALGAQREHLIAKVVGGASQLDDKQLFRIGERNFLVLRKILWKNDILITSEDVGGTASRTVYLSVGTGQTVVRSEGALREL